jgi:hypothetical protein
MAVVKHMNKLTEFIVVIIIIIIIIIIITILSLRKMPSSPPRVFLTSENAWMLLAAVVS